MRRFFLCGLAAAAAVALAATPAQALRIALPVAASTKTKAMQADAVVVGKVTGIDKETVDLEQFPGSGKVPHTVANIKIETSLLGAKNVTHIKLAYVKPGEEGQPGDVFPGGPGIGRPFPGRGFQAFTPTEDQEGVFFLQKHPTSDKHFVVPMGHSPILSTDANYKDELEKVKGMAGTFADPVKALKVEKEEERVANALTLAQKYRSAPQNNNSGVLEETAIPAEETKLLLKVLAEVDWTKHADAPRLADVLGLMPGNYGIPRVAAGDTEEPLAARQKAFKAWADKYAAKFEVKKVAAKPMPADAQPKPGRGIDGGPAPAVEPAVPPRRGR
jgi:hypothetical protein